MNDENESLHTCHFGARRFVGEVFVQVDWANKSVQVANKYSANTYLPNAVPLTLFLPSYAIDNHCDSIMGYVVLFASTCNSTKTPPDSTGAARVIPAYSCEFSGKLQ